MRTWITTEMKLIIAKTLAKSSYRQIFDELFEWIKHYDFNTLFYA